MADYIDKHKAYLLLKDLEAAYIYPPVKEAYGTAARRIDQIKPADVQPVKHGQWICDEVLYYNGMTKCSCCNEEYYTEDVQNLQGDLRTVNYCPNCGARMDGDKQ